MDVLALIVLNVIVPVFILIGAGILLHRKFRLDLHTLSKLTTNFFMPAIGFANIYESNIQGRLLAEIVGFLLCRRVV